MDRRTALRLAVASGAATVGILPASAAGAKKPAAPAARDIFYRQWGADTFAAGTPSGVVVAGGALTIGTPARSPMRERPTTTRPGPHPRCR